MKARTTLLLALSDEHQLRFSKYKTAQELWAAILKTFGGNEATKKTKKNQLKQHYGNFKAEGKETLEQTFNRLHAIVEWLMHTIVWRNRSDLDTMSLDDLYNHLKENEPEVQKKSDSQNMAFISSAKNSSGNEEVNTASISTASTQVSLASANVAAASISLDTACAYIASQSPGSQIKYEEINQIDKDDVEEMDIKWNMALLSMRANRYWKKTRKKISIQGSAGHPGAKTGVEEKTSNRVLRPSPAIESNPNDLQNNSSFEIGESTSSILSKPEIKFVKAADSPTVTKTNKDEVVRKPSVKYAERAIPGIILMTKATGTVVALGI
nr:hypothetical protein [Tanacetum cinerariifolium]